VVQIDKSSQRMAVSVDGTTCYSWPVSTGRDGFGTQSGTFNPQSTARHYFSCGPASHGCVRLHPSHAAALFVLVQEQGPRNTRIKISN
jgi:lipoprotein-anchoring transpeptidase ErfK/SrfK